MTYIIKMKRFFCMLFAALLLISSISLISCSERRLYSEGDGKLNVLCTVFAPFDFARIVGGERVKVTLLQDNGSDMHSYTPTGATLKALSEADAFIYIGGVSDDAWASDAISAAANDDLVTLRLIDLCEPIHAELENDWSGHQHEHEEHGHEEHHHGGDEHIWTSLRNAAICVQAIRDVFCRLDPKGADIYTANAAAYILELEELDRDYKVFAEKLGGKVTVFADRFPFVHLMHDYKLPYIAAFSGCSTEVNASFEMQISLIEAVNAGNLSYVVVTEGGDKAQAEAVAEETGCKIVALNSLQSVKKSDVENGLTYLGVMRSNLAALKEAEGWN